MFQYGDAGGPTSDRVVATGRTVTYMASPTDDSADPHVIVLVGATGDLSKRKLLPGMFHLYRAGLARDIRIVGTALDDISNDEFLEIARAACREKDSSAGENQREAAFASAWKSGRGYSLEDAVAAATRTAARAS